MVHLKARASIDFRTESGKQQIFIEEKDKKTNKFKLLFFGNLNAQSEGQAYLKNLVESRQVEQVGNFFSYETSVVDELFQFLYSAKASHLISDTDALQLQKFAQASKLKFAVEEDLDEHMSDEIELLLNKDVCEIPSNSPFSDTDLIVLQDSYSGRMPLNGIKEGEFKRICELYENICQNKTHLVFHQNKENPLFFEAIKTLLTRDVGRRLIDKCASNEKYGVSIVAGARSAFNLALKAIELDVNDINLRLHASPDGFNRLDKQLAPLYITLAHEMIHHVHEADGTMRANLRMSPTLESEYDNLEEQATIAGFYKKPALTDFISEDKRAKAHEHFEREIEGKSALKPSEWSEASQPIYDEFNERIFQAAFTDSKNVLYPRFGHRGLADHFRSDAAFNNPDHITARILSLESEQLVIDLLEFLLEASKKGDLVRTKTWESIKPCLKRLIKASKDLDHPLYPQLQHPNSKACLQALHLLSAERTAFLSIKQNALDALSRGGWIAEEAYAVWSNDASFILQANTMYSDAFEYASPELQANEDVVMAAIKDNWRVLKYANPAVRDNIDIILAVIKISGQALEYASPALQANEAVVMAAVEMEGKVLRYASSALQDNERIVLAAVKSNASALKFASKTMKNNQEIFLSALDGYYRALEWAGEAIKKDEKMVMLAVLRSGTNLQFADKALQSNEEIVLAAIQQDPSALCYASRDIIKTQVQQNGRISSM